MKKTRTARILATGLMFVIVLGVLPLVVADDNFINSEVSITVEENGYPTQYAPDTDWFVPGDPIYLTLKASTQGQDGIDDLYDIIVFPIGETAWSSRVIIFDDIPVDLNGDATVYISGTYSENLGDGWYDVYVGPIDWIQNSGFDGGQPEYDWTRFRIQMYQIQASTDRQGYIPGDDVSVFYSVISIKDGSLITQDMYPNWFLDEGAWAVWSEDGETRYGPTDISEPLGTIVFKTANAGASHPSQYIIGIWYNGTYGDARRAMKYLYGNTPGYDFRVDGLEVSVQTDKPEYEIDSIVRVDVRTTVWVEGTASPGTRVQIEILEGALPFASVLPGYGGSDFYSDSNGAVHYMFQLDGVDFEENQVYTVLVSAERRLKEAQHSTVFEIVKGLGVISVNMVFNQDTYTTGDWVAITVYAVAPVGHSPDFTYIHTVYSESAVYAKEARDDYYFDFGLPNDFVGVMNFKVEVYNTEGDHGSDFESKTIVYGIMLVNVNKDEYTADEILTVSYELIWPLIWDPEYYYTVRDAKDNIVSEDMITGGAFTFTVPSAPSLSYTFYVYATQDGTTVSGFDSANLRFGYVLTISFDKSNYSAGDIAIIHYKITSQGDADMPPTYDLVYGLYYLLAPKSLTTTDPEGDLTYLVPSTVTDGSHLFVVEEHETGTIAIEIIRIGPEEPVTPIEDFDDDGVPDSADSDDDNDGYSDVIEEMEDSDPKDADSKPADYDGDYIPDSTDVDDDNDGFSDGEEVSAGSDPKNYSSVPEVKEIVVPPRPIWEWLVPMILGAIAVAVASGAVMLIRRPPKGEPVATPEAPREEPEEAQES